MTFRTLTVATAATILMAVFAGLGQAAGGASSKSNAVARAAAASHKYQWSKMSVAATMSIQRKMIVNDWRVITRWKTSRWVKIDANNIKFVDRVKPDRVVYAQNHMKWTQRELRERVLAIKAVARRQARSLSDGAEFACIHSKEGSWKADTGNGYYGGLQMDLGFQATYGGEFIRQWGTADNWPVWAQVIAARRARDGYHGYGARGYNPWPETARACGQL